MKTFAVLLAAVFLSVGSAQARTPSSSLSHAHFPACSECAAAGEMPSPAILSFVGQDGIATPSTACAGSNKVLAPTHCLIGRVGGHAEGGALLS